MGAQRGAEQRVRALVQVLTLGSDGRLVQAPDGRAKYGRLGDTGGRDAVLRAPHRRAGEVGVARGVKDDVRDHPVVPLPFRQALQFAVSAIEVEGGKTYGHEGRVPVPLERIKAVSR